MSVNIDTLAVQMSLDEVNALLKQKEKNLDRIATLQARKADLEGQIAAIDSEVAALSGDAATVVAAAPAAEAAPKKKGRRGRPKKRGRLAMKKGPAKKTGKRRGRPPKSVAEAPKRRGRPPKAESAKKAPAKKKKRGKRSGPSYREMAAEALTTLGGEAQLKDIASIVSKKKTGNSKATASLYTTVSTAMRNASEFRNVGRGRWKLVG